MQIDKKLVEERFAKSVSTYDDHAVVQKQMANDLVKLLVESDLQGKNSLFEYGCGTGFLTKRLFVCKALFCFSIPCKSVEEYFIS